MVLNKQVGQLRAHATQTLHSATADKKQLSTCDSQFTTADKKG
jgi:fructose-specific component phosphotransferase system IIB-like protein